MGQNGRFEYCAAVGWSTPIVNQFSAMKVRLRSSHSEGGRTAQGAVGSAAHGLVYCFVVWLYGEQTVPIAYRNGMPVDAVLCYLLGQCRIEFDTTAAAT